MIRNVKPEDVSAITDIYNHYVRESTATFETEPVTEEEMRNRVLSISAHFPYLVDEENGVITGYCYAHPWKARAAYQYTLETTVYLAPEFIGKGIGRLLMERLIEESRSSGFRALIACITAENESSCSFHERLGFEKVSHFVKVGEKFGRRLDVVDYELLLNL
jgi:L-amino acid N-acyltransferase YncA